jgi:hypothetical protein
MMKNYIFIITLLVAHNVFAQYAKDVKIDVGDKKATYNSRDSLISQASFNKLIKLQFGQLATGQTSANVASNFGALDITQGKFVFNGSLPVGNSFFITAALEGSIDNNVSQIFNNFKLNNNTSVDLRLNFRLPGGTTFFYTKEDKAKLQNEINKVIITYEGDTTKIGNEQELRDIRRQLLKYTLDSIDREIDVSRIEKDTILKDKTKSYNVLGQADFDRYGQKSRKLLELKQARYEVKSKFDSLTFSINRIPNYANGVKKDLEKRKDDQIEAIELDADWNAIQIQWLSIRINPVRSKFYIIDTFRYYFSQVFDTVLTNSLYALEYSYYFYSRKRKIAHYANVGVGYSRMDNRKELVTFDVTDTWKRDSARTSRTYSSKVNAYSGKLSEDRYYNLYFNYYIFLLNRNSFGFHTFPDIQWREGTSALYNLGLGLIFSFKKKGEEKTIINAEPYFKLTDISDVLGKGTSFIHRNVVGVRFGIPFNPDPARRK